MMVIPEIKGVSVMQRFVDQHKERIVGGLSRFDRMLFRGTLRFLQYQDGIGAFLATHRVLIKDFGKFAQGLSEEVKEHAKEFAAKHQRPLPSFRRHLEGRHRSLNYESGSDQARADLRADLRRAVPQLLVRRNRETKHIEITQGTTTPNAGRSKNDGP